MKKEHIIHVLVLVIAFVLATLLFSYFINRGNTDMTADMGEASLPQVTFLVEGRGINTLAGYVSEVDMATIRDSITPTANNGELTFEINGYNNDIKKITYEVLSLDGEQIRGKGDIEKWSEAVTINVQPFIEGSQESVFKLRLQLKSGKKVDYFTRVTEVQTANVSELLQFVERFHAGAIEKKDAAFLSGLLEKSVSTGNNDLHQVTIQSDIEDVQWGQTQPTRSEQVRWSVKEINSVYGSVILQYQVELSKEEEVCLYNVNEFFRVGLGKEELELLDYQRSMSRVLTDSQQLLSEKGIGLGIRSADIQYLPNPAGTIVTFVQEREVWSYNKDTDELAMVFGFAKDEGKDTRNLNDQHEVKLLWMDKKGNTAFLVSGYMNRGEHEGELGVLLYYYSQEKNYVEKKAFIPYSKPLLADGGKGSQLVFYNVDEDSVYVMVEGTLHKVDLKTNKKEILVKDLQRGQYTTSEDGNKLAYQEDASLYEAKRIKILDFQTGDTVTIKSEDNACIRPIGFVYNDFVYGMAVAENQGLDAAGNSIFPMHRIQIVDHKGKELKSYEAEGTYTTKATIDKNMVTLERVVKTGTNYIATSDDFISNNEEVEENTITLAVGEDEILGTVRNIVFEDGIKDKRPKLLSPKQVLSENTKTIEVEETGADHTFYVYSQGALSAVHDEVAPAIEQAEQVGGVVVADNQSYVWEPYIKQNRYEIDGLEPMAKGEGETTLEACKRGMLSYDEEAENLVDMSGCTLDQLRYIIGNGTPVIALLGPEHAVLLSGFSQNRFAYMDPLTGKKEIINEKDLQNMVAQVSSTFMGYVK